VHILVGKAERKRPLGRHKVTWKDNIKTDFKVVHENMDGILLAQDSLFHRPKQLS
jgi:hypothetical protein